MSRIWIRFEREQARGSTLLARTRAGGSGVAAREVATASMARLRDGRDSGAKELRLPLHK
jgi:hypothetical protein